MNLIQFEKIKTEMDLISHHWQKQPDYNVDNWQKEFEELIQEIAKYAKLEVSALTTTNFFDYNLFSTCKHLVIPHIQFLAHPGNITVLLKAIERIRRDYPTEYQIFISENCLSEQDAIHTFQQQLYQGSCLGYNNSLLENLLNKHCTTLKQSIAILKSESVFYHQLLHGLGPALIQPRLKRTTAMLEYNDEILKNNSAISENNGITNLIYKYAITQISNIFSYGQTNIPQIEQETRLEIIQRKFFENYEQKIANFGKKDIFRTIKISKEFRVIDSAADYQKRLQKFACDLNYPKDADILGSLCIRRHTIAFQKGTSGYFICDPIHDKNTGLFQYPSEKSFFKGLRHIVNIDILASKIKNLSKETMSSEEKIKNCLLEHKNAVCEYRLLSYEKVNS